MPFCTVTKYLKKNGAKGKHKLSSPEGTWYRANDAFSIFEIFQVSKDASKRTEESTVPGRRTCRWRASARIRFCNLICVQSLDFALQSFDLVCFEGPLACLVPSHGCDTTMSFTYDSIDTGPSYLSMHTSFNSKRCRSRTSTRMHIKQDGDQVSALYFHAAHVVNNILAGLPTRVRP